MLEARLPPHRTPVQRPTGLVHTLAASDYSIAKELRQRRPGLTPGSPSNCTTDASNRFGRFFRRNRLRELALPRPAHPAAGFSAPAKGRESYRENPDCQHLFCESSGSQKPAKPRQRGWTRENPYRPSRRLGFSLFGCRVLTAASLMGRSSTHRGGSRPGIEGLVCSALFDKLRAA
jgi:hypothetical protein